MTLAIVQVTLFGLHIPLEIVILGVITGLIYSLLAVGIILAYKSSRVINFAHGEMGALAAGLIPWLVIVKGWPYWPAVLLALAVAALTGVFMELVIIRHFSKSARLIVLVATIGASQLFFAFGTFIPKGAALGRAIFPTPFRASVQIGSLTLSTGPILILITVQLLRSWLGEKIDHIFKSHSFGIVMGILLGITTMLANAAGPVAVLYLLSVGLPKWALIGTSAFTFFVINLFKVPFSAHLGLITPSSLMMALVLAPLIILGFFCGKYIAGAMPQKLFETFLLICTAIGALRLIW